jgi:hypothetical protein
MMKNHKYNNFIEWLVEFKHYIYRHHQKISFAQEGEDLLLERIFYNRKEGFYVDIGAHHPFRFSNTMLFYKKGWNGINIDPSPGSMKKFKIFRSRDLNLELSVSNNPQEITYYRFADSALNTFSKVLAEKRISDGSNRLIETKKLKPVSLYEILVRHLNNNSIIDYMSIDVEGHEFEVVSSNDWTIYRPKVVLVEILYKTLKDLHKDRTAQFLKKNGYHFFAKTMGTCFFITEEFFHDRF